MIFRELAVGFTNHVRGKRPGAPAKTIARAAFWNLFLVAVTLGLIHAAVLPFWPAIRPFGVTHSPAASLFLLAEGSSTLLCILFAGLIALANLAREDDSPIRLDLDGAKRTDDLDEPSGTNFGGPTTGAAFAAILWLVAQFAILWIAF